MDRLEIKAAFTVSVEGTITGMAWPFGSPDRVGDLIEKGAFATTTTRLPMLFAHDQAQVIGVWEEITETDKGLIVKGRLLVNDVARAREVRALVLEGAVSSLSIGFVSKKAASRRGGGRTISALDLHEISIVSVPCHPGARIITAKSANKEGRSAMEEENTAPDLSALEAKMTKLETETKSLAKIGDRLDKMEARLNRPSIIANDEPAELTLSRKAFVSFARSGLERMPQEETKSLTVANDASGGFLAPEQFASEILKKTVEYSPIRQYARVVTIGAAEIKLARRVSGTTATWVSEIADRTASEPVFDQVTLTPFELATYTDVSTQLLEDNSYNLEGELTADFAESFGVAEGTAFVKGTGTGQPKGLLTATGIAEVKTGLAANFPAANPADVIIGMFHALPTVHAQNGAWVMNRKTLGEMRKWKDSTGRYLVIDPISEGAATTLLGRPIVEALDMPDIAANAYPILFGDLQGYRIVDRVSLSLLRDPFTLATKGQVRFHARRRVGADVTNPDRFVKLKVAA
ncbi:phage major capsid protein [Terrihabitans rhizophilus]|uniref:Phage major capsid protein n=1 Tax=Terrihabitans rhizophilus TaxID=3092662 RepID=A0ABU4RRY0_9HYPH|nr:phage major capsid protein [Terrihabitans sp. PJ23]MDX6806425.1 phage major capsid protein [Terrihabitans sp. PJ23]